ncbi:hypothetical protein K1W69_02355 [Hoeflea sp. WL0058]|uniref:Uncharacterized protein n=1 Tax=Flavimaribacter sediminis TaxID=2865987 RepID=A0AAE2ZKI4_9HYPH|nr:hypothetical protein [Flavimaribacter sediminis]MBW8636013.1 hypothetical protein [Flavimaribacter sediminis]
MYLSIDNSRNGENKGQGKPASQRPAEARTKESHYLDKLERIDHFRKRLSW